MRTLSVTLLLVAAYPASASSPDPKRLVVPPEVTLKAQELIGQLGSDDFTDREAAHERLSKMGRLAKPALSSAAARNPDPEVRSRCRELLPKAAAEDMKARLETFLADADGKFDHDLPGWNEFKKVTGSSAGSRELFTEMMNDPNNRALLIAFGTSSSELGALVANRKMEFYNWRFPRVANAVRRDPTPTDITALLFAESLVEAQKVPRTIAVSTLFVTPGFSVAVGEKTERGAAIRAVIGKWLDTRDDPVQMSQALSFASSLSLPEASGLAAKLLAVGSTAPIRLNAAYTIAKLDGKKHAAALEKALDDNTAYTYRTSVGGQLTSREIQVRDAALAALVMMSGQSTEEYGFVEQFKGAGNVRYSYTSRTLPDDVREKALARWKAWREKNPDWTKK
jgi:hypothetical protein